MNYQTVGTIFGRGTRRWYDGETYRRMLLEEAAQAVYEMTHPDAPVGTPSAEGLWRQWWGRLGKPDLRARRRSLAFAQAADAERRECAIEFEPPF